MSSRILAVIPARGGSKGIPRKNIKPFAGKPLIAWTIECALRSSVIDRVIVSTDDDEISEVALRHGATVPFLRPAELALDTTPGIDPVLHALDQLPEFNAVVLLQPTSPLRISADIDGTVALARQLRAPATVSVSPVKEHPNWMFRLTNEQRLDRYADELPAVQRQALSVLYALNGAVYFARSDWLRERRSFLSPQTAGYVMPPERALDLDSPLDWRLAEYLFLNVS